jgi:hypothetical protein
VHAARIRFMGTCTRGNSTMVATAKFRKNTAAAVYKAINIRLAQPALHGDRAGNVSAGDQPVQ